MNAFIIRPLQTRGEYEALVQADAWRWFQRRVDWHHELILAYEDGGLVGYCVIEVCRPRERGEIVLAALESRRPGVGRALLHELNIRTRAILIEDVPASAVAWLERQGFAPPSVRPARPRALAPDVAGDLVWHRRDDEAFADAPLQPLWPGVALGRLLA